MEFILFLAGIALISLLAVGKLLIHVMEDITRRMHQKRQDAETRAAMAPKDYLYETRGDTADKR